MATRTPDDRQIVFPARVDVRIEGGAVKVQIPKSMRPGMSGSGHDGWWELADAKVSDDEIAGHFSLNFIIAPRVRIDRLNGEITMEGRLGWGFQGTCSPETTIERRF